MKKVSAVITTYNSQDYIVRALKSIINQTYKCFEIIVVDDFSVDRTCDIVRDFQKSHPNVKLYINKKNMGGPAYSRNLGIRKSNGDYLAFLDSDDFWLSDKIKNQIFFLENNNYQICGCKPINNRFKFISGKISLNKLIIRNRLYMSSIIFDLKKIRSSQVFFNESRNYHGVEDYDFILKCKLYNMKIYNLKHNLISYTENKNSLSHKDYILNEKRRLLVLKNLTNLKFKHKALTFLVIFLYKLKIYINEI